MVSSGMHNVTFSQFKYFCDELQNQLRFIAEVSENDVDFVFNRMINVSNRMGEVSENYNRNDYPAFFDSSRKGLSSINRAFVNYYCLRLSSVLEQYLRDTLKQMLKLNAQLLERGFHEALCSKDLDLIEKYDEQSYMKYLNTIASHFTQGQKFKGKYKRFSRFIKIDYQSLTIDEIDNLFVFRNDIAHLNRHSDEKKIPKLKVSENISIDRESKISKDDMKIIAEYLIALTNRIIEFLRNVDLAATNKWKFLNESPQKHYEKAYQLYLKNIK
ncbi:hypothetical protein LL14B4_10165 [Lactococcus lactis subsp. lactis]|uniref:RiboL-PSP-HEPN domain-containing protein n=1 Tax=Lactococcus lactis subsp. lactis TaxID=1360 RepID=A0A2Z3KGC1_LACLL|nr:hypothetical protein [Lactococcus lactis]AWN66517.1 hypothetical protein LL14B4_10165 [Lactococcus lactis subsp. lactis]